MQKSLSDLISLPHDELTELIDRLGEPLLVTQDGEPKFVAQSLNGFEAMVRRLRLLEAERITPTGDSIGRSMVRCSNKGQVIPFPALRADLNPRS
jgi:hypothetical protein